jgi:MarR family transcriptional regulator, transcriptional regulator for hemolysin
MPPVTAPQPGQAQAAAWAGPDCLGRRLTVAARHARQLFDHRLAAAGSTFATYVTLGMLARHGPVIQRQLATMLGVEPATLTRQLDRLERDGLVARQPVTGDRRAALVRLTRPGRILLQRLDHAMAQADAELCARLTAEQAGQLRGLLDLLNGQHMPREAGDDRLGLWFLHQAKPCRLCALRLAACTLKGMRTSTGSGAPLSGPDLSPVVPSTGLLAMPDHGGPSSGPTMAGSPKPGFRR